MNKNYNLIIALITALFFGMLSAQETQKNFINYQGVARNSSNELMVNESMNITIGVKFGGANTSAIYEENHSISTDVNGVFSLLIGNGSAVTGNYNSLPWGSAATFVTVSINGNEVGTTEMMAVPYAISAGNMKGASASEVTYDNSTSGLTAMTAQDAIDELVSGGSVDADADPSNELQMLSFDTATNELSLSDGNSVTIPSGGTDADADPTNELQTISFDAASNKISLTDGGEITIPSGGTDADADPANELQTLSFDAGTNELSLSDGNSVTIPSGGSDADTDPTNELQDISLSGTELTITDGSTIDFAPIIPPGGTDNQNLTFNETTKILEIEDGNTVDLSSLSIGGGGSSLWSQSGGDIYYNSGKVGIGTTTPETSLSIKTDGSNWNLNDTEGDFRIGDATHRLKMSTSTGGAGAGNSRIRSQGGSNRLLLGSGADDVLTIVDQKVGIGTLDPTAPLDVVGKNNWDPSSTEGDFRIGNDTYRLKVGVALGGGGAGDTRIRTEGGTNRMMLGGGTNDVLTVTETNVGVGTITPAASLDVQGDIRSSDLAGAGQRNVMADADGNLVIGASGGGSSLWADNAGDVYYNSGNVGIGTTTPKNEHHVHSSAGASSTLYTIDGFGDGPTDGLSVGVANGLGAAVGFLSLREDGPLNLETNNQTRLSIRGNGLVGIGTQAPTAELDVDGAIRSRDLTGGGNVIADADGNLVIGSASGGGSLWSESGTNIHFNGGNVGIGTDTPSTPLDMKSNATLMARFESTSSQNYFTFSNDTGYKGYLGIWTGSSDMDFGTGLGNLFGKVHLTTGASPKLTVEAGGDVGIGTTTPTAKLDVVGDIRTSGEVHGAATGGANMIPIAYGRIDADGTIISGTGNFSVSPLSSTGNYVIDLIDENNNGEWVVVATALTSLPRIPTIGYFPSASRRFSVMMWSMTSVKVDTRFSFVVYKK